METTKCEHNVCSCLARPGDSYCSDHCEDAASMSIDEIACDCGCPECG